MFCGIVQRTLILKELQKQKKEGQQDFATLVYDFPEDFATGLQLGASVAQNGVCLTVRTMTPQQGGVVRVTFDAIDQTLKLTNLGNLKAGDAVNIERAAKVGDEIGGHVVSGHVFSTVSILAVEQNALNMTVVFERPAELRSYLLNKGFVALNGCSLTIADVAEDRFSVCLIPETRDVTNFGRCQVGDAINLEIDSATQAIVDTVKELARSGQLADIANQP